MLSSQYDARHCSSCLTAQRDGPALYGFLFQQTGELAALDFELLSNLDLCPLLVFGICRADSGQQFLEHGDVFLQLFLVVYIHG